MRHAKNATLPLGLGELTAADAPDLDYERAERPRATSQLRLISRPYAQCFQDEFDAHIDN
jgi:hypothetical protein